MSAGEPQRRALRSLAPLLAAALAVSAGARAEPAGEAPKPAAAGALKAALARQDYAAVAQLCEALPKNEETSLLEGAALCKLRRFEDALRTLSSVQSPNGKFLAGTCLIELNRLSEAAAAFASAANDPKTGESARAGLGKARLLLLETSGGAVNGESLRAVAPLVQTSDLVEFADRLAKVERYEEAIAACEVLLERRPEDANAVLLRMALAEKALGRHWETMALCARILDLAPSEDAEEGALRLLVVSAKAERQEALLQSGAETYLAKFSAKPGAAYVRSMADQSAEDPKRIERYWSSVIRDDPAKGRFQRARVREANRNPQGAAEDFAACLEAAPEGPDAEKCAARLLFLRPDSKPDAENYLRLFPKGESEPLASFKAALFKLAENRPLEAAAALKTWIGAHPGHPLAAEAKQSLGEALALASQTGEALAVFKEILQNGSSGKAKALRGAVGVLESQEEWRAVVELAAPLVSDGTLAVQAALAVSRAQGRLGLENEKALASVIGRYLLDPKADVETAIAALARLMAERGAPEFSNAVPKEGLARYRILFAKAELARLEGKPDGVWRNEIAAANPADLSPALLAAAAETLFKNGEIEKARAVWTGNALSENNALAAASCLGLGALEASAGRHAEALEWFEKGLERDPSGKELVLGKARELLATGQTDAAKELLLHIAQVREWHGETTAEGLYRLGEIAEKNGQFPEAVAYYQRVFLGYHKFASWAAKSYVRSAACFEKLGREQEARNTYRELANDRQLASLPEAQTARAKLQN